LGAKEYASQVEDEWAHIKDGDDNFTQLEWDRVAKHFTRPQYKNLETQDSQELYKQFKLQLYPNEVVGFKRWLERNTKNHQVPGYISVVLSLKPHGTAAPGDASANQMTAIADLADLYSFGELRVTHEQNILLADVEKSNLLNLWRAAKLHALVLPNIGLLTDIIACPGGDFCSLANAKSLPIAKAIQETFDNLDYLHDLGDLSLNISGCINSCGHHHVGNIGILGVDKDGEEWYQITLGGEQGYHAAIGKVIGPSFKANQVHHVIKKIIDVFVANRGDGELFIDVYRRLGITPFKQAVYENDALKNEEEPQNEWAI
jgi:sulfite reductase (NADPH) hemoprotein beta-component